MITDIEKEFNTEIQELKKLGIEEDEVKDRINELRAEHRSKFYVKGYLRSWATKMKEQQVVQEIANRNHPLQYFLNELSKTVKYDRITSLCNLATAISAYTNNPLNSYLKGPSSIGKTYSVIETTKYFPEEDVWNLGGMSPTALIHERGIWIDSEGREIRPEDEPVKPKRADYDTAEEYQEAKIQYEAELTEWNERIRNSCKLVDISHKILLFLEAPHPELLNKIKPILSHDKEFVMFKITDRNLKGQLETITTIIKGFPAVFVCSTRKQNDEIISRFFTYTPEMEEKKYKAALEVINERFSELQNFNEKSEERKNLEMYIRAVRRKLIEEKAQIRIPFDLTDMFTGKRKEEMRFYRFFLEMVQAFTALSIFNRPTVEKDGVKYYLSTAEDVVLAYVIYRKIKETTETGEEQGILNFYHKHLKIPGQVYSIEEITQLWNAVNNTHLSKVRVRQKVIDVLTDRLGYLERNENPDDKRSYLLKPVYFSETDEEDECMGSPKLVLTTLISKIKVSSGGIFKKKAEEWFKDNKIKMVNDEKLFCVDTKKILLFLNGEEDVDSEMSDETTLISKIKVVQSNSEEKNAVEEEEEIELELIPDEPDETESNSTRNRQSCEVCGKVTNLVPVVRNNKTIMVCRVCREKVKREQFNERYHKPWNIGGVNLI